MGEMKGFMIHERQDPKKEPVALRVQHYREFTKSLDSTELKRQGSRCMDCGVPFCHKGCPLGNLIPEWNHLVSENRWQEALMALLETNNFPEFTGRICPAPCESACVLGINEDPVAIEAIEMTLSDMGYQHGWIKAEPPSHRSGFRVAVIGSGPAGLAAAQQLNRKGHLVDVYERADRPGGLLMYGIPDFKLEKARVLQRIKLMEEEGVQFKCGVHVGRDLSLAELQGTYDSVLLTCGATKKRDVPIPGRQLKGIYFAETFLTQSTKRQFGDAIDSEETVWAEGKNVVVIGGGDTGSDCVGTSNRQKAKSVTQFEIMPMPPQLGRFPRAHERPEETSWPDWPYMLRTSSSHEEGCERHWSLQTKEFVGDENGRLKCLVTQKVEWIKDAQGRMSLHVVPGSEKEWPCELVFIAVGFVGAETEGLVSDNKIALTERGNIDANSQNYATNLQGVFAAGDVRRGQSLVVWAIKEGRDAAAAVDRFLSDQVKS
ncbi:MAG: glutamate synthase subunit beta [Oligoflexus sp.]